jgi:hypothetical protein
MFQKRSTIDIVVILLAATVALTIFTAAVGVIVAKAVNPSIEISRAVEVIANTVTTIVGALVGFIGGRAIGRNEGNGK